jgi:organic radical activating enzyme
MIRDYYCSRKFTEMSIDIEHRAVNSCCSAMPKVIDFADLTKNGLLNNSHIKIDRERMLRNERVESCENFCWAVEDKNIPSSRIIHRANNKTYLDSHVEKIQSLNIILGSRCTLTCSYCNKNYSRAWAMDIEKNGNYSINTKSDAYTYTKKDLIIKKLSQEKLYSGANFENLYHELEKLKDSVTELQITGGEPFLYDRLLDIVSLFACHTDIVILTGSGVPADKFSRVIDQLKGYSNVTIGFSSENLYKYYEFNRHGNTFENFLKIYGIVKQSGLKYKFFSVLSNLTIFGFIDFVNFVDADISQTFCNDPSFLRIGVLDERSRNNLIELYDKQNNSKFSTILEILNKDIKVSQLDKINLSVYIKEFATRRNLDLDIFPSSFISWLNVV